MTNFKTCINGHNYEADKYPNCPYCPGNSTNTDYEKTLVDFKKTQLFDKGNINDLSKTMLNEENVELKSTPKPTGMNNQNPLKRTSIVVDGALQDTAPLQQNVKRKIVGWIVTFNNDEFGQDFKIYVGKNKIGSAPGGDILINDTSISGEHATILFRENVFLIKDNFSTNGTKVNGVSTDEGKLNDGDEIKLGNTTFKFKTVF